MNKNNNKIAIISGSGLLPMILSQKMLKEHIEHCLVYFTSFPPEWVSSETSVIKANFERIGKLFNQLRLNKVDKIVFAGALDRPTLNLETADDKFLSLAKVILPAMNGGDDQILSLVVKIFQDEGFEVLASEKIEPALLVSADVLTDRKPTIQDFEDIDRAKSIVNAIGLVDVGQASVVSCGMCLGVETAQGTEQMLNFVKQTLNGRQIVNQSSSGVLFKGPKANQSLLVDFPTIGPETILQLAEAKLNGVAISENGVFILDLDKTISLANKHGLFLSVV